MCGMWSERDGLVCGGCIVLRQVLYLYTAAYEMSISGFPLAAPLPLSFPADTATWTIDDQLLLGP